MIGTSLNSTLVPCPVPLFARVSSSMRFDLISQARSVTGQVVNDTSSSVTLPFASTCMLRAAPRALRSGSSNSRALELRAERRGIAAAAAAHLERRDPRIRRAPVELGAPVLRVVFEAIGADDLVALAHHDIAGQHGVAVDVETEVLVVGLDGDRSSTGSVLGSAAAGSLRRTRVRRQTRVVGSSRLVGLHNGA